ncbi:MAG: uncharacterized protein KVP18_001218 [Porospora cf. gigantea A]|nr:MAG: hypothetical protein KVP18_001218 [Porospora cf. gigantea A]
MQSVARWIRPLVNDPHLSLPAIRGLLLHLQVDYLGAVPNIQSQVLRLYSHFVCTTYDEDIKAEMSPPLFTRASRSSLEAPLLVALQRFMPHVTTEADAWLRALQVHLSKAKTFKATCEVHVLSLRFSLCSNADVGVRRSALLLALGALEHEYPQTR